MNTLFLLRFHFCLLFLFAVADAEKASDTHRVLATAIDKRLSKARKTLVLAGEVAGDAEFIDSTAELWSSVRTEAASALCSIEEARRAAVEDALHRCAEADAQRRAELVMLKQSIDAEMSKLDVVVVEYVRVS